MRHFILREVRHQICDTGTISKVYLMCVHWLLVDLYSKNVLFPLTFWVQFCHLLHTLFTQQKYTF